MVLFWVPVLVKGICFFQGLLCCVERLKTDASVQQQKLLLRPTLLGKESQTSPSWNQSCWFGRLPLPLHTTTSVTFVKTVKTSGEIKDFVLLWSLPLSSQYLVIRSDCEYLKAPMPSCEMVWIASGSVNTVQVVKVQQPRWVWSTFPFKVPTISCLKPPKGSSVD